MDTTLFVRRLRFKLNISSQSNGGWIFCMSRKWFLTIVLSMLIAPNVWAQCDLLSQHGVYDTSNSLTDEERGMAFRNWFCQQQFKSASQAESAGGTFKYKLINLGYNQDSESWEQFYASYCSETEFQSSYRGKTVNEVRRINPGVIDALKACLIRTGLHASVAQGENPRSFRFYTVFNPPSAAQVEVDVVSFTIEGGVCKDGLKRGDKIGPQGRELLCHRNSDGPVDIAFNASYTVTKDTPLSLKAIVKPPEYRPMYRLEKGPDGKVVGSRASLLAQVNWRDGTHGVLFGHAIASGASQDAIPVYVGTNPAVNGDYFSTNQQLPLGDPRGTSMALYGYLSSTPIEGVATTPVYQVTQTGDTCPGYFLGILTTDTAPWNCTTTRVGYAYK